MRCHTLRFRLGETYEEEPPDPPPLPPQQPGQPPSAKAGATAGESSGGMEGWYGETPAGAPYTRGIRVVVKSYIACIGLNAGSLPLRCSFLMPGGEARLRALALATDALMCEGPMDDAKDKRYRLFSACTFSVTCQDGRLVSVTPSPLDTDTGKEGPLQAPPLLASPVAIGRLPDGFTFSWFGRGRPNLGAEPPFQLVCPRLSVFIWHRVNGQVRCTSDGTDVQINLSGSRFPSHRAFVNGSPVRTVPQGGFARLWFPASFTEPTRVEGFSVSR